MYKIVKNVIKFALLLLAIALVFDLHYQGQSIRAWAKDYALKASAWLYKQGKDLVGKDLKDLTPSSIPKGLENSFKALENNIDNGNEKKDVKKNLEGNKDESKNQSRKPETTKTNVTKLDQLTDADRAKLKELLDQKSKTKPSASSL